MGKFIKSKDKEVKKTYSIKKTKLTPLNELLLLFKPQYFTLKAVMFAC